MSKFYKCDNCGLIMVPDDADLTITCCDEELEPLNPNTSDGAGEKHVPVVTVDDNTVTVSVGEVDHPMLDEHYITEIFLDTNKGSYRKKLSPGAKPVAVFELDEDEEPVSVYEYCNLHGLWEKKM